MGNISVRFVYNGTFKLVFKTNLFYFTPQILNR